MGSVRKVRCQYCWDQKPMYNMTLVPRDQAAREKWSSLLGKNFESNISGKQDAFICRRHFKERSVTGRRSKNTLPEFDLMASGPLGIDEELEGADESTEVDFTVDTDCTDGDETDCADGDETDCADGDETDSTDGDETDCSVYIPEYGDEEDEDEHSDEEDEDDKLSSVFKTLSIPHLRKSAHYSIVNQHVRPVIQQVHDELQKEVIETVVERAKGSNNEIHVAGDAQFDSPESSKSLEPKSLQKALINLQKTLSSSDTASSVKIKSITTDRDASVAKLLTDEFPDIAQMYDGWHYVRNLKKTIWKNVNGFKFKKIHHCDHGALTNTRNDWIDLKNRKHKRAWDMIWEMTTNPRRLKDLHKISPFFNTSEVESYNALTSIYHPKDLFFHKNMKMRVNLTVLHWNSDKLEWLRGDRKVLGKKSYYNKSSKEVVWKDRKSAGSHAFRKEIVLRTRASDAPSSAKTEEIGSSNKNEDYEMASGSSESSDEEMC
ncbi:hypothetical protein B9Z55_018317 [Caenorhabditis nigoni]|uniref:THAP-type domain-containing protein n=1 Tax=Caenorhabditis nigoni TaxID=1611254 RepID=A0A2G5TDC1_9PELO|nr:hypothetical protein B9Z55_018317 [Caenorhabditis nigoni]